MAESTPITGGRTIGLLIAPLPVKLSQCLGLTLSSFAIGTTLSTSLLTVPALLRLPTPLLLTESTRLSSSAQIPRAISLLSSLAAAWLAYREPTSRTTSFGLYAAGAAFLGAGTIWNLGAVLPIEFELRRRAQDIQTETAKWVEGGQVLPAQRAEYDGTSGMFRRWAGSSNDLFFPILRNAQLSTRELVDRWALLGLGTALLGAVGTACYAWGVVCNETSIFE